MARPRFQPKITRARYVVSGFKTAEMLELGKELLGKIKQRIAAAKTIEDMDARPLSARYLPQKRKYSSSTIRDLKRTGFMLGSMHVTEVNQNKAVIYFSNQMAVRRMAFNQRRSEQWGTSPSDSAFIAAVIDGKRSVQAETVGPVYKIA